MNAPTLDRSLYCQCHPIPPRYGITGDLRCRQCHLRTYAGKRASKVKQHGTRRQPRAIAEAHHLFEQDGWTVRRLAEHYGVTYHDIRNAFLHTYGSVKRHNRFTALELSRVLGHPSNACVRRWIRDGELPATPGKSHRATVVYADLWITRAAVMDFLTRQDKWMCWEPARITDPALRAYAATLRGVVSWRWLHVKREVTVVLCANRTTVEKWIRDGYLPAVKEGGFWYVRSDHAAALAAKMRHYPKDWMVKAFRADPPVYAP